MGYFPRNVVFSTNYESQIHSIESNSLITKADKEQQIESITLKKEAERQEKSYIGQLGHAIEPVIAPLGYDWKMGVCILTGLAAKEIVVSTMGILYQAGGSDAGEQSSTLKKNLMQQKHTSGELKGQKVFNPLVAFGFMIFILIYFPCVAVIAAIKKESNWKWSLFTMVYTTGIAWTIAFLTYQIGSFLS